MKATGIVRRIDDLGRVVIPKEIRRTMHIREGAPLEIFTDSNGLVIFKKYSPIGELSTFAAQYVEAFSGNIEDTVAICDCDRIIAVSSGAKKELGGKEIGFDIQKIIEERKTVTFNSGEKNIKIGQSEKRLCAIAPIIAAGDIAGAVLLFSDNTGEAIESDLKLIQVASNFLAKQLED